jgi:hypothetical protein
VPDDEQTFQQKLNAQLTKDLVAADGDVGADLEVGQPSSSLTCL